MTSASNFRATHSSTLVVFFMIYCLLERMWSTFAWAREKEKGMLYVWASGRHRHRQHRRRCRRQPSCNCRNFPRKNSQHPLLTRLETVRCVPNNARLFGRRGDNFDYSRKPFFSPLSFALVRDRYRRRHSSLYTEWLKERMKVQPARTYVQWQ